MTAFSPAIDSTSEGAGSDAALCQWRAASWAEYCQYRDDPSNPRLRLFFDDDALLLLDMGWEGIDHAGFCDLFLMLPGFEFSQLIRSLPRK